MQGEGCKHFAEWTMQPFEGSFFFPRWMLKHFAGEQCKHFPAYRVDTTHILKRKYCKYFKEWMLQKFCRVNTANKLKGEWSKHFKGWTLQTFWDTFFWVEAAFCRLDGLNILQGGCCKYFKGGMLQTFLQDGHCKNSTNNNQLVVYLKKIFTSKESISIAFVKETRERPPRFP